MHAAPHPTNPQQESTGSGRDCSHRSFQGLPPKSSSDMSGPRCALRAAGSFRPAERFGRQALGPPAVTGEAEAIRILATDAWGEGPEMMGFLAVTRTDICYKDAGRDGCYR